MSQDNSQSRTHATMGIQYADQETAGAILRAITPDNYQAPEGITLEAKAVGGELRITVTCEKGVGSLLATLNDVLQCVQAAEKALMGVS